MIDQIRNVLVIGAGQMGSGIAQVFAQSHYKVFLYDNQPEALDRGWKAITQRLKKQVEKGQMVEQQRSVALRHLQKVTSLEEAGQVDLVVEAVVEAMQVKADIFAALDTLMPEKTILASNTSSLPITEIAAVTQRPQQVIGMHFMNPVPVMPLVEVIRGLATDDAVYETVKQTAEALGKTAVEVMDSPGFVSNRVLMPMINEAIYAVYEGVATPEAVDAVMKLGMNHPMGPLTLADFIGLDTCLSIMEVLHEGFGEDKYRPCPLLRKYVKAGWLGKKTGKGFYNYS
ncbi:3-hydroxybutyryl-CoA dehydrogenase [Pullulanibacillus camelliae]|uniref:3-hydroxybutyryl-CoA dehydrogenase n=1 Tax=Pullulanibacillus camelliae TaxID=1707096 RepID=A0A8J2VMC6_9BACL|nr:3-hydroxybutyryl-CoA dehydrogenase [Pullulanibacillus camelliae]GGE28639.1 3-hydroxybutyryl-CoA dehydrogenase [Pullulanibacillus camelliae]